MNWISVKDRLPEVKTRVIVYIKSINLNKVGKPTEFEIDLDWLTPFYHYKKMIDCSNENCGVSANFPCGYTWNIEEGRSDEKCEILFWMPLPDAPE